LSWPEGSGQARQVMSPLLPTRERILRAAHSLFLQRGYGRISVDLIANAAGVTKRTLYHYFRSKDDLLADVVGIQSTLSAVRLRQRQKQMPMDVAGFIDEIFGDVTQSAAMTDWVGVGFTKIALEMTHLPGHPARTLARRHKEEMEAWLSDALQARRVRDSAGTARDVMLLLEGCLVLTLIHGDRTYAERAADTARLLMTAARSQQA
jgi:AcrR family transcriptional regulator